MVLWKFWDCGWRQLYPGILYLDRDRLYGRRGCIRLEEPDEAALKKRRVEECDERNRLLGLRSWAYSGYAMFLLLYLGFLASGFFDRTVMYVLAAVLAAQAALLLVFRLALGRVM